MKLNKNIVVSFIILLVVAALYRAWPGRPFGFAPQVAMAIFGGAMIRDKRYAIILPLVSLLISDVIYEILYQYGVFDIAGFYKGQWLNYLLFVGLTVLGFAMKKVNVKNIGLFTVSGSLLYFLASNFAVWIGGGGLDRPRTFNGLMQTYGDALAFYRDYGLFKGFYGNFLIGDLFFAAVLFGAYFLIAKPVMQPVRSRA